MPTGLILEGGAMRGAYTAGALQALEENKIDFKYIAGVSAGALTAVSYVSGQCWRNYESMVKLVNDRRYFGLRYIKSSGSAFNFDFMLDTLVNELVPLDFDAFWQNDCRFLIGTTDIETGKPVFFDKNTLRNDPRMRALRASGSLPLISRPVELDGKKLLDGGMTSIVPIERSLADGNEFNLVIFTKHRSFVRGPQSMALLNILFKKYPEFLAAMRRRPAEDSRQRAICFEQEKQGKAIVLCPNEPLAVGKMERDPEKLASVYEQGRREANARMDDIKRLVELGEKQPSAARA